MYITLVDIMISATVLVFSAVVACSSGEMWRFPPGFQFGASTAAYQVEGGWNASDKGESNWDRYTHELSAASGELSDGNVAAASGELSDGNVAAASGELSDGNVAAASGELSDGNVAAASGELSDGNVAAASGELSDGNVAAASGELSEGNVAAASGELSDGNVAAASGELSDGNVAAASGELSDGNVAAASGELSDSNVMATSGELSNGNVAADSYHLWRRDVQMARELGLHFYSFSISWPRLLPTGYSNVVSDDGARYYNDLIDALLEAGIEPVVTLHRFDLPQLFQDYGGWLNPLIVQWFAEYASVVFSLYGDRVRVWDTIAEPSVLCSLSYSTGLFPPGLVEETHAPFLCTKHVLLAHARAWRIYHTQYKPLYHGKVSITNHMVWLYAASEEYSSLTKQAYDFMSGRHTHPIYSSAGGWPPSVEELMQVVSAREGYNTSRLPELTNEEIHLIRGTYDYFSLSYFTCRVVRAAPPGQAVPTQYFLGLPELRVVLEDPPGQRTGALPSTPYCPGGLRAQLSWIQQQYGDIPILIALNGVSTRHHLLEDTARVDYIRSHLEQVLVSIHKDAVNVTGYTYYSLMDGFQWLGGYSIKFGLYEVDTSPRRLRTPRASAHYYRDVIHAHALNFTLQAKNQSNIF